MLKYVATFFLSFALGFGAHAWHTREVTNAVNRIRKEKDAEIKKLCAERNYFRSNADNAQHLSDCADAYRKGKEVGRYSPASNAERFAHSFENRHSNVTFIDTTNSNTNTNANANNKAAEGNGQ